MERGAASVFHMDKRSNMMMVWERELLSRMITSDLDGGGVCSTVTYCCCWWLYVGLYAIHYSNMAYAGMGRVYYNVVYPLQSRAPWHVILEWWELKAAFCLLLTWSTHHVDWDSDVCIVYTIQFLAWCTHDEPIFGQCLPCIPSPSHKTHTCAFLFNMIAY